MILFHFSCCKCYRLDMKVILTKKILYSLNCHFENFPIPWNLNHLFSAFADQLCSWYESTSTIVTKSYRGRLCKVYSPWIDVACSFLSFVLLFGEVFRAFSVEKREKYNTSHATYTCSLQTDFHLEDKKKVEKMKF